jgi:CRISPR-associated exonuclease Cas4
MVSFLSLLLVILVLAALLLLRRARAQRREAGLPPGRVVYADTGAWARCEEPLFSPRYRLTGRPDYLVEERGRVIPVEVKPSRVAPAPYPSDVLQLAAYCLLVEETTGQAPPQGLVKYRDTAFAVDYTPQLRAQLLDTLARMRCDRTARDVPPSHDEPGRCRACGFRSVCGQPLV